MKRIFITGASGCIGHYITEALIQQTDHELYLLVRNPQKLKLECLDRARVHLLQGDMSHIEEYSDLLLKNIDVAIVAATAWGGTRETYDINVDKTLALINLLNPNVCERVIYFSTASILDRHNRLLPAAEKFGHDYIRTKYQCFVQLSQCEIADKIIALFPTLVFGGDRDKPYSHLSAGLADVIKWIDLIRWFRVDGSFHYIHARDIALVVAYLVNNHEIIPRRLEKDGLVQRLVLGNPALTVDRAIAEICAYLNKRIYLRIPLYIWLANIIIKIFHIQMDSWSKFSLEYRHFTYQNPVTPVSFGLNNYCSTIEELMKISKV
ncbi:NAD(P)-dependent oxidoreductase [Myxosarcina sp. GI1]|uniref:NAD-dependent epimerase/dehydratase family protein n=1 Tax=Myxosarcina sp. GI1 TaxID=1541065 RepID=UPI00055B1811|nr:NAD(P)-dependent oxidoreductase [Myxosarcina sp. GI1]